VATPSAEAGGSIVVIRVDVDDVINDDDDNIDESAGPTSLCKHNGDTVCIIPRSSPLHITVPSSSSIAFSIIVIANIWRERTRGATSAVVVIGSDVVVINVDRT
jgi:hypothetical protein